LQSIDIKCFREIGDDVTPRLGRPRTFLRDFVGRTSFGRRRHLGVGIAMWVNRATMADIAS
jgi:hypothetical protein